CARAYTFWSGPLDFW
nr:immunoglobulin heavy chain junction region [Macaca mulatta]MOW75299.1 immunoglobulin heavy chain junction region [Macaca mulatta]MOW75306.1 immunoglobulin heavy chain junction region [Macaca mulatta]MOW75396.1 immunoglobulin heavy chain junction region [Macaca mulatta]MOW75440.1 immunoglobulin heavy chain junction region [Macaca mulatta]